MLRAQYYIDLSTVYKVLRNISLCVLNTLSFKVSF